MMRALWSLVALAISLSSLTPVAHGLTTSAVAFHTAADWVEIPDAPSLSVTTNLTVEAWAKPLSLVTGYNGLVSKPGYALALQPMGDGFAAVLLANIGGKTYAVGTFDSGPLGLGQWYHIAGTYDGATLRVF